MGFKRIKSYFETILNKHREIFQLYTTGLSRKEVERLLKKDTLEALTYYKARTIFKDRPPEHKSLKSHIEVYRAIFVSFIMQLTPARRLFYILSFCGFVLGMIAGNGLWIIGAFVVVNLLLALELADKLTTRDELEIAREIQVSLEPEDLPETPWLSVSFTSKPAKIVGGDFFNFVKRSDDQILSIVGDVAGKGIPAALYAAHIQSMFEPLSEQNASPASILNGLNHLICKRLREGDFITAVIAFFESGEKSLTIARAGHNWPLYYNSHSKMIEPLKSKGVCLGIDEEMGFSSCLEEKKLPVNSGDVLLLYSDGITEAMNASQQLFDQSRLESALLESAHFPAEKIIECINLRIEEFVQSEEPHDDVTMVALKVK
ncbi:MAG: PP2C family protein-serine/threonine phosphatase [Desulfobacterales bacterium]|nr:PP2C family protein-serine/threonine phosphatase [Desulfobacterales bacterium]